MLSEPGVGVDHSTIYRWLQRHAVMAKAARRAVQVRAYADRILVRFAGETIADHTIYDSRHYLPVLVNRPCALRNGTPFRDRSLRSGSLRLNRKFGHHDEGHRRFSASWPPFQTMA
jgi:hypothetical protein